VLQTFAIRISYVDYTGSRENEEAYLDDLVNFWHNFNSGPVSGFESRGVHVEVASLSASLYSLYEESQSSMRVRIETRHPITTEEFNKLLGDFIVAKDRGITKIEAIGELPL
jgi:hypothetical protein